jgi:hypothetical protein
MIELINFLNDEVDVRLQDIYLILQENIPKLNSLKRENFGQGLMRLSNLKVFLEALNQINEIKLLEPMIERISEIEEFKNLKSDSINIVTERYNEFNNRWSDLYQKVNLALALLSEYNKDLKKNTFSILLPELKGLTEYSKFFSDLDKIILSPSKDNEIIDINSFDVGSKWINITISSAFSIFVIMQLTRNAFDLYTKDYHQMLVMQKVYQAYDLEKEVIEKIIQASEKKYNNSLTEKSEGMFKSIKEKFPEKFDSEKDFNEYKNNLKFALENLNSYIDKGMEIYKSIEEDKIFPEIEMPNFKEKQKMIDSNTKAITEK